MAVEIERLVAVLEANMTKFDKAIAKASGSANAEFLKMEKRGSQMAANMNAATATGGRGFESMGRNINAVRGQTANLASQFNDIAVQLQSGTSPLTIALQQGTQINQVLGPLGVRGAVGALGGALASLFNPVSLLTIGIIGLGGAAVQYFTSVFDGGEQTAETIQKQADLIRQVAKEWGDAVPALQAYVDELDRAKNIGDLQTVTDIMLAAIFEGVRPQIDEINVAAADLMLLMRDLGASDAEINSVRDAFSSLQEKTDDATATADDFKQAQDAVSVAIEAYGIPAAQALMGMLSGVAQAYGVAASSAAQFRAQSAAALATAQNNYVPMDNVARGEMARKKSYDPIETIGLYVPPARSRGGRGGGGGRGGARSSAASEAERERKAVADLIETLTFEQSLLGMSDIEKEKANALRKAGAAATDEQKAKIGELVTAMHAEREALKASEEAMRAVNDLAKDALSGFIKDMVAGKSASEALAGALDKVGQKLLDIALNGIFDGLFSGGGGIGGIIGSLFGGRRASGGPVSAGKAYLVGERGPEIMLPRGSGTVIPNKALTGGSGRTSNQTTIHIDARGAQAGVGAEIDRAVRKAIAQATPGIIGASVQTVAKRNALSPGYLRGGQ